MGILGTESARAEWREYRTFLARRKAIRASGTRAGAPGSAGLRVISRIAAKTPQKTRQVPAPMAPSAAEVPPCRCSQPTNPMIGSRPTMI